MINYLEKRSSTFSHNIKFINKNIDAETTSIFELREKLKNKDYEGSKNVICKLVNLSDGRNLIEFMLEISMLQSGMSLQIIWPIYKILNFISFQNKEDVKNALAVSSRAIILDDFQPNIKESNIDKDEIFNNIELDQSELYTLSQLYEIQNTQFIRSHTINNNVRLFLYYFKEKIDKKNNFTEDIKIASKSFKREELVDILLKIGICDNNILLINSLRAYMKNCNEINYDKIIHYINQLNG